MVMDIHIDCEAYGGAPVVGQLSWFGAVSYPKLETFEGLIIPSRASRDNPAIPEPTVQLSRAEIDANEDRVFHEFRTWLQNVANGEQTRAVSDNIAYDWQWINHGFWKHLGYNPMGHSGRRISDFYAGLVGDWNNTQKWKKLRITKHDHNPVHDALGNAEAFRRIMNGER